MNLRFNEGKRDRRRGLLAGVWLKLLPYSGCSPKTEAGFPPKSLSPGDQGTS